MNAGIVHASNFSLQLRLFCWIQYGAVLMRVARSCSRARWSPSARMVSDGSCVRVCSALR